MIMFILFQSILTWSAQAVNAVEAGVMSLGCCILPLSGEGVFANFVADAVLSGIGAFLVFVPQIIVLTFVIGLRDSRHLCCALDRIPACPISGLSRDSTDAVLGEIARVQLAGRHFYTARDGIRGAYQPVGYDAFRHPRFRYGRWVWTGAMEWRLSVPFWEERYSP